MFLRQLGPNGNQALGAKKKDAIFLTVEIIWTERGLIPSELGSKYVTIYIKPLGMKKQLGSRNVFQINVYRLQYTSYSGGI